MSLLQELNKCILPVKIYKENVFYIVTSFNKECVLCIDHRGNDKFFPTMHLEGFSLDKPKESVVLFRYNYYDKDERFSSPWTTESWENWSLSLNFTLNSTEKRTIEL